MVRRARPTGATDKKRKEGKKSDTKRERGFTNARARSVLFSATRCGAAWRAQGRQRTRNYRRGYIPGVIPRRVPRSSRNFAPALARRASARTRVMTFSAAALKIAPRAAASSPRPSSRRPFPLPPPTLPPPSRPLKGPYRPAKSGDYPRTIVPVFTSRRCPPRRVRR